MNSITSVTQKGQITIPAVIREKLGLEPYGRARVELGNGFVKITPTEDILDLAGKIKAKKGKTILGARESMEKRYRRM